MHDRISDQQHTSIQVFLKLKIEKSTAKAHVDEWSTLTPAMTIESPYINPPTKALPEGAVDLDSPDELSIRSSSASSTARAFLVDAHTRQRDLTTSTYMGWRYGAVRVGCS
jgi:hypothetical protein